ncbi:MAG: hypothetical protein AAFR61_31130, partial [Bacteroidota bacterium]
DQAYYLRFSAAGAAYLFFLGYQTGTIFTVQILFNDQVHCLTLIFRQAKAIPLSMTILNSVRWMEIG